MKISEQNNLRVLLLAIALTILGGATGIMFYASEQNEAVLASESELLAIRTSCPSGQHKENNVCVPNVIETTDMEKCNAQAGMYWDQGTATCRGIKRTLICTSTQEKINGECVEKSTICKNDGGFWNEKTKECVHCQDNETFVNGICIENNKLACERNDGTWNDANSKCLPICASDETLVGETCVPKKQVSCEEQGWVWQNGNCTPPECPEGQIFDGSGCVDEKVEDPNAENREKCTSEGGEWDDQLGCSHPEKAADDLDGDGIPNSNDDDIDGDGYLNDDDADAWYYNVGDRDLLMFATLAYEPVSASQDKISGDTLTGNGKSTVKGNYYQNHDTEPADTANSGYPDYFNYVCNGPRSLDITSWKQSEHGDVKNPCMIDEEQMIGMQAQNYSTLDEIIGAWQTIGADYYFAGDEGGSKFTYYASIKEVNQWLIVDHTFKDVTISKRGGRMEATVFRLNNNYVIAYRGTDFTDLMEWIKDGSFATNQISGYEEAAQDYARYTIENFSKEYFDNPDEYIKKYGGEPNFYITGHSLGGYLSQIGALGVIDSNISGKDFLRDVVYFNGMGIGFFGGNIFGSGRDADFNRLFAWAQKTDENGALLHKVMCYNNNGDLISALGRHVNQTGYYVAEGAIKRHASKNVALLQSATRLKIADGLMSSIANVIGKQLGGRGIIYNRLDEVNSYAQYYKNLYDDFFKTKLGLPGSISILDLVWFSHEPSASLFYNISQGVRGTKEKITVTKYTSGKTTVLTAQVNGDVESYSWYKDGVLVGNGRSYDFIANEANGGVYTVTANIISRSSNKKTVKKTIAMEGEPIKIDSTAPVVRITTEKGNTSAQSGETVNFIVRVTDKGGFADGDLAKSEISISGTAPSKGISVGKPTLSKESNDYLKVWKVPVKSDFAGTIKVIIKDGAFKDTTGLTSNKAESSAFIFTVLDHGEEDRTKPTVKISALKANEAVKGESLDFKIEGYDESGFKSVNLNDNVTLVCTLGKSSVKLSKVEYSSDRRTASATATISCGNDSSIMPSYGSIYVNLGAFVDANGNKNNLKASSSIKFTAPPDKVAPSVKITSIDGTTAPYGGSLRYTIAVEDASGISDDSSLEGNIEVVDGLWDKITISGASKPTYNNDKTKVSYTITVTSNENCSKKLGCRGTFKIKAGAFKDNAGNSSLMVISGNIAFASEKDVVPPTVQIAPISSTRIEAGGTISFQVIVTDAGGVDTTKPLKKEDFTIDNKGNANVYVESVSEPKYNSNYTQAEYIVVVRGNDAVSNIQLHLNNGAVKDNAGNSNPSILTSIIEFFKQIDLTPPKVTITPVTGWNAIQGNELKFIVKAKDENKLSKNKTVTTSSFSIVKGVTNDMQVTNVSSPTYSADGTEVSYTVTVYATKTGKAYLVVNLGAFSDNSDNINLAKSSELITYEGIEDKTPPKVSFSYNPKSRKAKHDKTIQIIVTVTDNNMLVVPDLKPEHITVDTPLLTSYKNNIKIKVEKSYSTTTEAQWIITATTTGNFKWLSHEVEYFWVNLPNFIDGAGNQSKPPIFDDWLLFTLSDPLF